MKTCTKYIIIVFLLVVMKKIVINAESSSGSNTGNGLDQTILDSVSFKEKRETGYNLLNVLEQFIKPRTIARKALLVKRSAYKFLLNIYKNVLSNKDKNTFYDKYEDTGEFDISGYDINSNIIDQSDFIMTFGAHNPHSGNASKTNRGKRIWFDVSEVPQGQHIVSAQLNLYQSVGESKTYTVSVHRVADMNGKKIKEYINSANTTADKEGWISVDISQGLEFWLNHPRENRGLFLAVHDDDHVGHILRPDDVGIVGDSGVPEKQPFMVGFFRNSLSGKRSKHETLQRGKRDRPKELGCSSIPIPENWHTGSKNNKERNACKMKSLYMSFRELNWHDSIIAPEGIDGRYCSGECNYPMGTHMNASMHAIAQAMLHTLKPYDVPKPCCTPKKLSPISVLYLLDEKKFVLKKFEDMVIDSCGCH